jgi:phosphohistidine phosphatase
MKNLTLIRHAKSDYQGGLSDKQRIITENGIENSILVFSKYKNQIQKDYSIYSSNATRAILTSKVFLKVFDLSQNSIQYEDDLYTFDASDLERFIKSINNNVINVLIFGHNGAITDFVNKFGDIYIDNVPTSGLVSINFNTDNWKTIQKGKTIKTLFPKELK